MKYFKTEKNILFTWMYFLILSSVMIVISWRMITCICGDNICIPSIAKFLITGSRFYTTDDEIRQAILSISPLGNFITCDIRLIQKKIKCFPWIQQVSVRKQWPNIVKIYIVEYVPVAYWNYLYVMLTRDAVVFTIPQEKVNQKLFPILFGPIGSEKNVLMNYYIFNEILQFSACKLKSVALDHRYSWQIILENDIKLVLGRKDYITRLKRFAKFYPIFLKKYMHENHECVNYIDLRYKSGFSIKKIPSGLNKIN